MLAVSPVDLSGYIIGDIVLQDSLRDAIERALLARPMQEAQRRAGCRSRLDQPDDQWVRITSSSVFKIRPPVAVADAMPDEVAATPRSQRSWE